MESRGQSDDDLEKDFGNYLITVEERDIDLLLMEEFHISAAFVNWFSEKIGLNETIFDGAWHSVSDSDGETDLLLRVISGDRKIAILIENKIGAPEQERQDERYHIRGARARNDGKCDDYITCICAPSFYLDRLNQHSLYQHQISYVSIREWYSGHRDRRSAWRQRILTEAIVHSRRPYVMVVNSRKTAFHKDYWEYLQRNHPKLLMSEPKNKGKHSQWIILKTRNMPKRVTIDHKNSLGCVDLTFRETNKEDLLAIKPEWPSEILPVQVGKSTALRMYVPKLDMQGIFGEQIDEFEKIITAVYRLSEFSSVMQIK
jgi:hypothetical protein